MSTAHWLRVPYRPLVIVRKQEQMEFDISAVPMPESRPTTSLPSAPPRFVVLVMLPDSKEMCVTHTRDLKRPGATGGTFFLSPTVFSWMK